MASLSLVSIIIPAFNAAPWIGDALNSVLAQTYPHPQLEIVVVDDGSTDDTAAVARARLNTGDIQWTVLQQPNGGPSRARNVGWQQARGQWIQFLDADDWLDAEKIAIQMSSAQHLPEEAAVVYSTWQSQVPIAQYWQAVDQSVTPCISAQAAVDLLRTENFIATGSQLFRRDWLARVGGFDEARFLIEDNQLLLRMALYGGRFEYAASKRPLFFYRRRAAGSLSQRDPNEFIDSCVLNAQLVEEHYRANGGLTVEAKAVVGASYFQAARYYAEHDAQAFERMVRQLERLQPHFVPLGPAHLRLLSRLIGYRRAERVAVLYRRIKRAI